MKLVWLLSAREWKANLCRSEEESRYVLHCTDLLLRNELPVTFNLDLPRKFLPPELNYQYLMDLGA